MARKIQPTVKLQSSSRVFPTVKIRSGKGEKGDPATVTAGTTTTGVAGTNAAVVNSGTTTDAVFDFTIPRGNTGEKGDKGDKGDTGDTGSAGEVTSDAGTYTDSGFVYFDGTDGNKIKDSGLTFKDEDNMASDSATAVPSQQSVKAYVDGKTTTAATKAEAAAGTSTTVYNAPSSTAELFKMPEGYMYNGKIVPSVASYNLTVALKTNAGTDPSASDPVYVMIGGTLRSITSALSVVRNAGSDSNILKAGSTELATKEIDYFVYLYWNTDTSAVGIGWARIPYYTNLAEFTSSDWNFEKSLISSDTITTAKTYDIVNIGRFAATNSGAAGYTWSVPTFTATNLIQRPIYETRRLIYAPVYTGFSSAPDATVYYQIINRHLRLTVGDRSGTSNGTGLTMTTPFAISMGSLTGGSFYASGNAFDNGAHQAESAKVWMDNNSSLITCYKTIVGTANWTNSGTKTCYFTIEYPI